jgi:hypothetical protein
MAQDSKNLTRFSAKCNIFAGSMVRPCHPCSISHPAAEHLPRLASPTKPAAQQQATAADCGQRVNAIWVCFPAEGMPFGLATEPGCLYLQGGQPARAVSSRAVGSKAGFSSRAELQGWVQLQELVTAPKLSSLSWQGPRTQRMHRLVCHHGTWRAPPPAPESFCWAGLCLRLWLCLWRVREGL